MARPSEKRCTRRLDGGGLSVLTTNSDRFVGKKRFCVILVYYRRRICVLLRTNLRNRGIARSSTTATTTRFVGSMGYMPNAKFETTVIGQHGRLRNRSCYALYAI